MASQRFEEFQREAEIGHRLTTVRRVVGLVVLLLLLFVMCHFR
jgi:hypothetical protein